MSRASAGILVAYLMGALLMVVGVAPRACAAEVVEYVHTDALGSPMAVTDASGAVIERTVYGSYGEVINRLLAAGPGYTGHVEDAETGLNYMQQRYYDPQLGVFLSVDPVTAYSSPISQFHRYRYANNNPYTNVDPDGRQSIAACANPANAVVCAEAGITAGSGVGSAGGAAGGSTGGQGIIAGILTALGLQGLIQSSDTADSAGDKVRDGTKPAEGRSGEKGEREGSGGQAGADGAFDSVEGSNERSPRDGVRVKDLEGGGTIETHRSTKSADYPQGTPTVKVQDTDGKVVTTARYPEEKK